MAEKAKYTQRLTGLRGRGGGCNRGQPIYVIQVRIRVKLMRRVPTTFIAL